MKLSPFENRFLQIVDTVFLHTTSMVSNSHPTHFEWSREIKSTDHIFLTHEKILLAKQYRSLGFNKIIGIFYESPSILSSSAKKIIKGADNLDLDLLIVSNSAMLKLPKSVWIPGGGIWNFENVKDIDTLIANKDSLISMACSGKNVTKLHRVRRRIFDSFLFDDRVTLFGPPISNPQNSDNMLTKFCFSIIVENHLDNHYFTEKILNCFAQGTIPVYLGSRNVDNYFDNQGIIHFSSIHDLNNILPTLTRELYNSKISSIVRNYHIALKSFRNIEDYIVDNIVKLK